jgi:hypothetical protein
VGEENTDLGLRCDLQSSCRPGRIGIDLWAGFRFKNFKFLSFSKIVNEFV